MQIVRRRRTDGPASAAVFNDSRNLKVSVENGFSRFANFCVETAKQEACSCFR